MLVCSWACVSAVEPPGSPPGKCCLFWASSLRERQQGRPSRCMKRWPWPASVLLGIPPHESGPAALCPHAGTPAGHAGAFGASLSWPWCACRGRGGQIRRIYWTLTASLQTSASRTGPGLPCLPSVSCLCAHLCPRCPLCPSLRDWGIRAAAMSNPVPWLRENTLPSSRNRAANREVILEAGCLYLLVPPASRGVGLS